MPRRRAGRARRKVMLVLTLGALGLLAGLLGKFGGFGAGGGGPSGATGPKGPPGAANVRPALPPPVPTTHAASRPAPKPLPVTRPLRITIRGLKYYALGEEVNIPQILELVKKVPDGRGPPIEVIRSGESLPTAENQLKKAFENNKIRNDYWPE